MAGPLDAKLPDPQHAAGGDGGPGRQERALGHDLQLRRARAWRQRAGQVLHRARWPADPVLTGQATKPAQAWQQNHDDHSTNMKQAGVLGDGLGDAAVHTIAIDIENAAYTAATGVPRTFGANGIRGRRHLLQDVLPVQSQGR